MATLYYGTDKSGNPVYESTTAGGKVDPSSATVAPNVADVRSTPSIKLATGTPTYGNTSNATAMTAGQSTFLEEQQKLIADQEAKATKREELRSKETQSLFSKLTSSLTSPLQARQDAQEETGIVPGEYFADQKARISEIDSLNQQYNSLVAQKDKALSQAYDAYGTNSFIDNRRAQIERNAAPQLNMLSANINSKAAVMQALQGNFREAQSFVNQAVQDATADSKFKYDLFQTTYDMNTDLWDRMDSIYSETFKNSVDLAKTKYEQEVADKTIVGDLMIKYNSLGAGINITDTAEEARAKAAAVGGDLALMERGEAISAKYAASGGSGGLTTSQLLGYTNQVQDNLRQDPAVKIFQEGVLPAYQAAQNAYQQESGTGDVVLMRMIAKMTDPTTGVREEEFRTFEGAQSTLSRFGVNLTKRWWAGDRLTQEGRNAMFQIAQNLYENRKNAYDNSYQFYNSQLQKVSPGATVAPYNVAPASQVATPLVQATQEAPKTSGFIGGVLNWLFK
jgi:hypothetical protein